MEARLGFVKIPKADIALHWSTRRLKPHAELAVILLLHRTAVPMRQCINCGIPN
jgi:hypothetical protein